MCGQDVNSFLSRTGPEVQVVGPPNASQKSATEARSRGYLLYAWSYFVQEDASREGRGQDCVIDLLCVDYTAKSDGSSSIAPGRHQQVFLVLIKAVGLGEIPERA